MKDQGFAIDEPLTNPRSESVRKVAQLAQRSARKRRAEFLVEGPQAVREALKKHMTLRRRGQAGIVEKIYASTRDTERFAEFAELIAAAQLQRSFRAVNDEVLLAMADTVTPQGIVAVCRVFDVPLSEVLATGPRLLAVLCRVQDPGNLGTIIRAADAAGADAVVVTEGSADVFNPKTVRSTVGSLFHLPLVTGVGAETTVAACRKNQMGILAADGYGDLNLDELLSNSVLHAHGVPFETELLGYDLAQETVWLLGNEAQGLSADELALAEHRVSVPLYGQAESLNVGVAAALCLYASAKIQRMNSPKTK